MTKAIGRHVLVARAFILFWMMLVSVVVPTGAAAQAPDVRIIMIDDDLFARLPDEAIRNLAIDNMIADLTMFDLDSPAAIANVVLYKDRQSIRQLRDLPRTGSIVAALGQSTLIAGMRNGVSQAGAGFDVYAFRRSVLDAVNGVRGLNKSGARARIDVHIFADHWFANESTAHGDLQAYQHDPACLAINDPDTRFWPAALDLAIEIRPPEGAPFPSEAAVSALMTVMSGTASPLPNILTRGVSGPTCALGVAQRAMPYQPGGGQGVMDCGTPPQVFVATEAVASCHQGTIAPAVSAQLDRGPIRLVARPTVLSMSEARFALVARPSGHDFVFRLGTNQIAPDKPIRGLAPKGTFNGQVGVSAAVGCTTSNGVSMRIEGGDAGPVQIETAPLPCADFSIDLQEVIIE